MSWLLFKLAGAGNWLSGVAKAVFKWIFADWRNGPLLMMTLLAAVHVFLITPGLRGEVAEWRAMTGKAEVRFKIERKAHVQTIVNYRRAQAEAERAAEANVVRVRTIQQAETRSVIDALENRLAAARHRYGELVRLRGQGAAAADPGGAAPAAVPSVSDAGRGAYAAAGDRGVPARRAVSAKPDCPSHLVCLSLEEALTATEDAERHDALIDWIERQARIAFVPSQAAGERDGNQ